MNTIDQNESLSLLKEKFPAFIKYWEDRAMSPWSPFADYTVEMIKSKNRDELRRILDFAEWLMTEGTETVKDGVATIFLESLMNRDSIEFKEIVPFLGKESREYCRAWDEFCGVRTEGLWTEEEQKALVVEAQINSLEGYRIAQGFLEKHKISSEDIETLLDGMQFVDSYESSDPDAWKNWERCVVTIKRQTKKGGFDIVEAYKTLQSFIGYYYQQTQSNDLKVLLQGMEMVAYKTTRDPTAWRDWIECVNSSINWQEPVK